MPLPYTNQYHQDNIQYQQLDYQLMLIVQPPEHFNLFLIHSKHSKVQLLYQSAVHFLFRMLPISLIRFLVQLQLNLVSFIALRFSLLIVGSFRLEGLGVGGRLTWLSRWQEWSRWSLLWLLLRRYLWLVGGRCLVDQWQ